MREEASPRHQVFILRYRVDVAETALFTRLDSQENLAPMPPNKWLDARVNWAQF